jgi:hypothetical protein
MCRYCDGKNGCLAGRNAGQQALRLAFLVSIADRKNQPDGV